MGLKEIELCYDTQSIKLDGDCVWPILRYKVNEELRTKEGLTSRTVIINKSLIIELLVTLFYGLKELLIINRYKFWVFSNSDRRKKIHGKYVDRVMEPIVEHELRTLVIENPYPLGQHYKKEDLKNGNIISQTVFFSCAKLIGLFLSRNVKVENEEILIKIFKESGISLDYKAVLKNHRAQYLFMKLMLKVATPNVVFFVYSASSIGYIKALKEKKIPVVELQHGVINELHYAYNVFKDFGNNFYPDYLLTYGVNESKIFDANNFFIKPSNVIPIGYYFLEEFINSPVDDFKHLPDKNGFTKIIVLSLQDPFEKFMFKFLNDIALRDKTILFLLVPRDPKRSYQEFQFPDNVRVERNSNVYECLKIADFHMTINSTCAIESLCFGVPNILYDYKNWASNYYGEVLDDSGHTVFVNSISEFEHIIKNHHFYDKERIVQKSRNFIESNFVNNLNDVIEQRILRK
ncbi:hypothetical protein QSV08_15985 [Maribacter sp. BPC-D8]|uniref:hypothetical protein n=1 Tax=Maribacter sp. BPC-D8 TaxID=3053613 RepID=UPI002B468D6E|nr:hypothetical protein [Maribacter sp. BPC-D8]WRI28713.1 hypothetical protein QSV08_15985 [Maribacter sp. BPC-D8]